MQAARARLNSVRFKQNSITPEPEAKENLGLFTPADKPEAGIVATG